MSVSLADYIAPHDPQDVARKGLNLASCGLYHQGAHTTARADYLPILTRSLQPSADKVRRSVHEESDDDDDRGSHHSSDKGPSPSSTRPPATLKPIEPDIVVDEHSDDDDPALKPTDVLERRYATHPYTAQV